MDRKTLEYMEERANRGGVLVSRIAELSADIQNVKKADVFYFQGISENVYITIKDERFIEEVRLAFIKSTTDEIERLEKELAEL